MIGETPHAPHVRAVGRPIGINWQTDIQAGHAAGQFTVADPEVALSAIAGGLIGLLRLHQRQPKRVGEDTVDELAEACLRFLGLPAAKARRHARQPLPSTESW